MKNMKVWLLLSMFVSCGFQKEWQPPKTNTYTFGEFAGYYKTEAEARSETRESHLVDYRYDGALQGFNDSNDSNTFLEVFILESDGSEDRILGNCVNRTVMARGVDMRPDTLYKLKVSKYGSRDCDPPLLDRQYFYFKTIEEIS